jgi:DNA-binding transcriptional MerR regulator
MVVDDGGTLWTIEELGARVAEVLLGAGYAGVPSGRVRDVPDARTIRYYTTLGLLDRAAATRGRTALYGPRHLRQLVAIKRLQARGQSLAEVQRQVAGASDGVLARLAGMDRPAPARSSATPVRAAAPRSAGFWREPLQEPELGADRWSVEAIEEEASAVPVEFATCASLATTPAVVAMQAARIDLDATLLLATRRPIDEDDLRVIRMATAPLIELLKLRGLIGPGEGEGEKPGCETTRE